MKISKTETIIEINAEHTDRTVAATTIKIHIQMGAFTQKAATLLTKCAGQLIVSKKISYFAKYYNIRRKYAKLTGEYAGFMYADTIMKESRHSSHQLNMIITVSISEDSVDIILKQPKTDINTGGTVTEGRISMKFL